VVFLTWDEAPRVQLHDEAGFSAQCRKLKVSRSRAGVEIIDVVMGEGMSMSMSTSSRELEDGPSRGLLVAIA